MTITGTDRTTANLATVTDIYAAFGRGDVPTILDKIAPTVAGSGTGGQTTTPRRPTSLGSGREPAQPVSRSSLPSSRGWTCTTSRYWTSWPVSARSRSEVTIEFSTPTGGRLRDEELHLWTLDDQQKVVRFRHYVDTAKHISVFAGEGSPPLKQGHGASPPRRRPLLGVAGTADDALHRVDRWPRGPRVGWPAR